MYIYPCTSFYTVRACRIRFLLKLHVNRFHGAPERNGIQVVETDFCPATEGPYVSPNGALASSRFFNLFGTGGSHEDYLHPAELRLIAEWLDIGGQYYNDLGEAPEAN